MNETKDLFIQKSLVAIIDVLGFSKIIENFTTNKNENPKLLEMFFGKWNYLIDIENLKEIITTDFESININGQTTIIMSGSKFSIQVFSDSIIIWSNDCSTNNDFNKIFSKMITIIHTIYLRSFDNKKFDGNDRLIPMRGALSMGWMSNKIIKNEDGKYNFNINMFYGDGYLSAYKLERVQQWMGFMIDDKVMELVDAATKKELVDKQCIIEYSKVPILKRKINERKIEEEKHFVIRWRPHKFLNVENELTEFECFKYYMTYFTHQQDEEIKEDTLNKIKYTCDYNKYLCEIYSK